MNKHHYRKKRWHVLQDKKVFETPIFDLHKKQTAPDRDSTAGDFYVLNAPGWINIIALTPERNIILVEQYRHGLDEVTLEIPGGMVDPGEHPRKSAERELLEETGYTAGRWKSLGKVSSNPAIMNNFTYIYLATECRETVDQQTGAFEDIYVHVIDMDVFKKRIIEGVIHHSIVLAAITKFLLLEEESY